MPSLLSWNIILAKKTNGLKIEEGEWGEYEEIMGGNSNTKLRYRNMKEIDTSEDLVIDLRMTLKTIFKKNR
jgi:hypothetical protein